MASLTLTLIGRDRPGLVEAVSERVAAAGGNWLEGRMARLGGQFAGILLVDVPDAGAERLVAGLRGLDTEGLRVTAERGLGEEAAAAPRARRALTLEVVGQDHPGIVRDIAKALAGRGVNIEELTTGLESAAFSGERMFKATARLSVAGDAATEELREVLEGLAHELMVDLELQEAPPA